jgi:hypothetical protein
LSSGYLVPVVTLEYNFRRSCGIHLFSPMEPQFGFSNFEVQAPSSSITWLSSA